MLNIILLILAIVAVIGLAVKQHTIWQVSMTFWVLLFSLSFFI